MCDRPFPNLPQIPRLGLKLLEATNTGTENMLRPRIYARRLGIRALPGQVASFLLICFACFGIDLVWGRKSTSREERCHVLVSAPFSLSLRLVALLCIASPRNDLHCFASTCFVLLCYCFALHCFALRCTALLCIALLYYSLT